MKSRPLGSSAAREGPFDRLCLRLGRAAILAIILLLPLAIAEGAARLLHAPEPIRRVYDPYAYRIPQPLMVDTFQTIPGETLDGESVTVRLNELGMRGPRLDEPTPADGLTLVFLGGSTTENYKFPRAETFPELIGQRVAVELGRPVRVFNAGMSAGTTATSLARLQHQVLDLEPSLIVVMHSINDLIFGFHPEYRPDGRHLTRPPTASQRPRSFLWDWLRGRQERRRAVAPTPRTETRRVESYEDFPALRVFERNLRSIAAVASAHDIPSLFLTQATLYRADPLPDDAERFRLATAIAARGAVPPDIPSLARGMAAFNGVVLGLAMEPSVHVHDLASSQAWNRDLIYDECHLTRAGNHRVADELTPIVSAILR